MSASTSNASTWRPGVLHVHARDDLQVSVQRYEGQTYYVVKNPASRKYFRLRPEAYFVLQQLDGAQTAEEICEAFEREFPSQSIEPNDLNVFIEELRQARFLHMPTAEGVDELYEDYGKRRWKTAKQVFANFLFLRIPLIDPDTVLERMLPHVRWLFSRPFRFLALLLMLGALALVVLQYETFTRKLPHAYELFTWRTLVYFWLAIGVSKILHEFGHGLTCKYYGGEVHEMGILFLVFTPCLYCNVSDAWMIEKKRHKILITVAGIAVEVFLASVATFLWWYSQPGFLNSLALAVMVVCSISTIVFNGNPLLRYDGYYALADWLEIPNLRTKANQAIWSFLGKLCAGLDIPRPHMPKSRPVLFATYAVASYLYRWIVMISIVLFLYTFLKPYKLAVISVMLGMLATGTLLILPMYKGLNMLFKRRSRLEPDYKRVAVTAVVLAGLVATVFWAPFPFRVGSSLLLRPRDGKIAYVQTPGILRELRVRDGQPVRAGQVLAVLENVDKRIQFEQLASRRNELQTVADTYRASEKLADALAIEADLDQTTKAIAERTDELAQLTLRASRDGTVILSGDPQDLMGKFYAHGEPLCMVADPKSLEAMLVIEQESVVEVRAGADVSLYLYSEPGATLTGTVREVSRELIDELPQSMTQAATGDVAARYDPQTGRVKPVIPSYVIYVDFDTSPVRAWPGLRGYAKVDCGTMTLAGRFWRWLMQTFSFKLQL